MLMVLYSGRLSLYICSLLVIEQIIRSQGSLAARGHAADM